MFKYCFFIILFLFVSNSYGMKIYEYYTDMWTSDPIPLEFIIYNLLKNNPIKKDVNYLALPWSLLIHNNKLNLVPNIKLNSGFTIVRNLRFEKVIPILKRMGITVLFTPHAIKKKYDGIKVVSIPHMTLNGAAPALNKDIFYSFIGCDDNPIRRVIFKMQHPENAKIIKRESLHFAIDWLQKSQANIIRKKKEKIEYQNILSRSRFVLCPGGTGPGTLRFWESLQAGAIPVLINDKLELPKGFDWNNCIVRMLEKDVKNISTILSSISAKKEKIMKNKCLVAAKLFCGANIIKVIKDFYEK